MALALVASGGPFTGKALAYSGGDGSSGSPFAISTCDDLQDMQDDLDAYYELAADIDCTATAGWNGGKGFDPIGDDGLSGRPGAFEGHLDGNNHTINGLTIIRADDDLADNGQTTDEHNVGLIGLASGAAISDIKLTNAKIKGYLHVGGIVGYSSYTAISNVAVNEGADTSDTSCEPGYCVWARYGQNGGGIVGYMEAGTIADSTVGGLVKGSGNVIGGLVGYMKDAATLTDSTSSAAVDGGGKIGGAVGQTDNSGNVTIARVAAHGDVRAVINGESGKVGYRAGGLVGWLGTGASVSRSYATGDVHGDRGLAGGLVGMSSGGIIEDSYATGDIDAGLSGSYGYQAGGLIGSVLGGTYQRVYASGAVHGLSDSIGGLFGTAELNTGDTLWYSFSTGAVSSSAPVGGLIGRLTTDGAAQIRNNYYDQAAAGTANCVLDPSDAPLTLSTEGCSAVNTNNTQPDYFYHQLNRPFVYNAVGVWYTNIWHFSEKALPELLHAMSGPALNSPSDNQYVRNLPISATIPHASLAGSVRLTVTNDERTIVITLPDYSTETYQFELDVNNLISSSEVVSVAPAVNSIPIGTYDVILSYQNANGTPAGSYTVHDVSIVDKPVVLCEAPIVTRTTISTACTTTPDEWGTTSWQARYSVAGTTDYHAITLADPTDSRLSIGGLKPATRYFVQYKLTNTYGTSDWLTIDATTLGPPDPTSASSASSTPASSGSITIKTASGQTATVPVAIGETATGSDSTTAVSEIMAHNDDPRHDSTSSTDNQQSDDKQPAWRKASVISLVGLCLLAAALYLLRRLSASVKR